MRSRKRRSPVLPGLPVAVAFGKNKETIGFDNNSARIDELKSGEDRTLEVEPEDLVTDRKSVV